ncbi:MULTISPECIES: hypothetical protein [unclassified Sphingomonas]|uniref:hypothetical protein n=1 Tax=unclassified Sphingomonas TaxID=196159 RepID=UPI002269848D|nr:MULTISPECIES: hypothetical protein [unclassified Sphingomonas]
MKTISLRQPLPIGGPVHHPSEGPVMVDDDFADHLISSGLADELGEEGEEADDEHESDDGLDDLTLIDLGLLVTKEGVPLNGATKKADIIAAIRAHRASAE